MVKTKDDKKIVKSNVRKKSTKLKNTTKKANTKSKDATKKTEAEHSINNKLHNKKFVLAIIVLVAIIIFVLSILISQYKNRNLETIYLETHVNETYEWKYEIDNESVIKFYKKQSFGDLTGQQLKV